MSTLWPNLLIVLGAMIVATGAWLGQMGWNQLADVRERQAAIKTLISTIESNRHYLDYSIRITAEQQGTTTFTPNYPPVDSIAFGDARFRNLFTDSEYSEFLKQLQITYTYLEAYKNHSTGSFTSPEQVGNYARHSQRESNRLARVLVDQFEAEFEVSDIDNDPIEEDTKLGEPAN